MVGDYWSTTEAENLLTDKLILSGFKRIDPRKSNSAKAMTFSISRNSRDFFSVICISFAGKFIGEAQVLLYPDSYTIKTVLEDVWEGVDLTSFEKEIQELFDSFGF